MTTCTHSVPRSRTPIRLAAASERSMIGLLPPPLGARSLILTTTCCFVRRFVTLTFVPKGKERCAAVNLSPL